MKFKKSLEAVLLSSSLLVSAAHAADSIRTSVTPDIHALPRFQLSFNPESLSVTSKKDITEETKTRLKDIFGYIAERRPIAEGDYSLILLGNQQKMYLVCKVNDELFVESIYGVSTARGGFSEHCAQSEKTPAGLHVIFDKHGEGLPLGTALKSRLDTGKIAEIHTTHAPAYASITSRVMWLAGREPRNEDSLTNLIYIHGTPREYAIGYPDSAGCIRMRNKSIIELFNIVPENTPIFIDSRKMK